MRTTGAFQLSRVMRGGPPWSGSCGNPPPPVRINACLGRAFLPSGRNLSKTPYQGKINPPDPAPSGIARDGRVKTAPHRLEQPPGNGASARRGARGLQRKSPGGEGAKSPPASRPGRLRCGRFSSVPSGCGVPKATRPELRGPPGTRRPARELSGWEPWGFPVAIPRSLGSTRRVPRPGRR